MRDTATLDCGPFRLMTYRDFDGYLCGLFFRRHTISIFKVRWFARIQSRLSRIVGTIQQTVADWDRECQLAHLYRTTTCEGSVYQFTHYGEDVSFTCGHWHSGERFLCDRCLRIAELEYPQGWAYYPGDTCEHGVYVGGCGIDWMCARCESL